PHVPLTSLIMMHDVGRVVVGAQPQLVVVISRPGKALLPWKQVTALHLIVIFGWHLGLPTARSAYAGRDRITGAAQAMAPAAAAFVRKSRRPSEDPRPCFTVPMNSSMSFISSLPPAG